MTHLLAFIGIAALVICTPGPDTALVVRNTLLGGRSRGVATAVGVVCGQSAWTLAASAGVAALVTASQPLFVALRVGGALYLVWLGTATLRGRERPSTSSRRGSGYRQGLVSNVGNPKMVVFFTSLLPQFAAGFAGLAALGLLFAAMTLAWLSAYALVVFRARRLFERSRVRRIVDTVTGLALVSFGIRLATERR